MNAWKCSATCCLFILSTSRPRPSGVAGLGLEHGHSVWIAESPREFADGILRLLRDQTLRKTLAENAREYSEEYTRLLGRSTASAQAE